MTIYIERRSLEQLLHMIPDRSLLQLTLSEKLGSEVAEKLRHDANLPHRPPGMIALADWVLEYVAVKDIVELMLGNYIGDEQDECEILAIVSLCESAVVYRQQIKLMQAWRARNRIARILKAPFSALKTARGSINGS